MYISVKNDFFIQLVKFRLKLKSDEKNVYVVTKIFIFQINAVFILFLYLSRNFEKYILK